MQLEQKSAELAAMLLKLNSLQEENLSLKSQLSSMDQQGNSHGKQVQQLIEQNDKFRSQFDEQEEKLKEMESKHKSLKKKYKQSKDQLEKSQNEIAEAKAARAAQAQENERLIERLKNVEDSESTKEPQLSAAFHQQEIQGFEKVIKELELTLQNVQTAYKK